MSLLNSKYKLKASTFLGTSGVLALIVGLNTIFNPEPVVASSLGQQTTATSNVQVYESPTQEIYSTSTPILTVTPTPTPKEDPIISIVLGGDVMTNRLNSDFESPSLEYSISNIASVLKQADVAIVNLETALCDITGKKQDRDYMSQGGHVFRAEPDDVDVLKNSGVDTVILANNHTMNYWIGCMRDTLNILDSKGIYHVGAGNTLDEARTVEIIEMEGIKIGLLAYTYTDPNVYPQSWYAGSKKYDSSGNAVYIGTSPMSIENMVEDVKKANDEIDFLIVSMHAGTEYKLQPTSEQKKFAMAAIDAGADLVYGHHPHVIQPMTYYKDKPIFFSLGNLIFDQYAEKEMRENLLVELEIQNDEVININYHFFYSAERHIPSSAPQDIIEDMINRLNTLVNLGN